MKNLFNYILVFFNSSDVIVNETDGILHLQMYAHPETQHNCNIGYENIFNSQRPIFGNKFILEFSHTDILYLWNTTIHKYVRAHTKINYKRHV